jgi:16S rRNA (adenine1518-N6/adenine1519-N6)-dimethyltransferase
MSPRLLGASDVRALAERYEIRPTKQRGQNFVIDANTVRRIVAAARLEPADVVLEIGPGLGSLTLGLIDQVAAVTAVEIDPRLAAALSRTVGEHAPDHADRLTVVEADALRIDRLPGRPPTAMVANLPYNVAVPVLLKVLETMPSVERVLVMVQLEVADRLAAPPGSRVYGVPSVKAAWYGDVRKAGLIGTTVFWPPPRVESGLVAITRRSPPETSAGRARVFEVVDAAFAQRRKTLRAALAELAGSATLAEEALRSAGLDPSLRGERLAVTDFARLAEALDNLGDPGTHAPRPA